MFNRLARALLLLTVFVALQASVLGGAAACALAGHHPVATGGAISSPSVGTSVGAAVSGPMLSMTASASPDATDGGARCEHESMPTRCAVMPVCLAFVAPAVPRLHEADAPASRVTSLVVLAPRLAAPAPELPPPRA